MSLGMVLSTATRPRIPLSVLQTVPEGDRIVVENIVNVAHDVCLFLQVTQASIEVCNNTYKVVVPFADSKGASFRDLQKIMTYNPGRLEDIRLTLSPSGTLNMLLFIVNEKTPYDVCEFDVIRVGKRRRAAPLPMAKPD